MLTSSQSKARLHTSHSKARLKQQLATDEFDLPSLFEFYQSSKQPISNLRSMMAPIQDKVESLMRRDYECVIINNEDGTLCLSYPYRLCIPVALKGCDHCAAHAEEIPSVTQLVEYFSSSSLGRGRGRFVAPVSLVHYCHESTNGSDTLHLARFSLRSASLVQRPEVLLNKVTRRRHRLTKSVDMTSLGISENVTEREKPAEGHRDRFVRKLGLSSAKVKPPTESAPRKRKEPTVLAPVPQPLDADGEGRDTSSSSSLSEVEVIESEEPMTFEAKEALMDASTPTASPDASSMSKIRKADAKSLRGLGVSYIGDLMVEEKLKLLGVLKAVSSEKADRHDRYGNIRVFCIPYPGYEYFAACTLESKRILTHNTDKKTERVSHHQFLSQAQDKLSFEWEKLSTAKPNVDKILRTMPENSFNPDLFDIEWTRYRKWHIDTMTQNYIKLLVSCFAGRDCPVMDVPFQGGGVLVHCIMGWDRTPTIVALLRLSLWADGVVNPSLSAKELIYLSIAYDWISFGHDLVYRSRQGVELMYYCFRSLELIQKPEYSFFHALGETELAKEKNAARQDRLKDLLRTFMAVYDECFYLL